MMHLSARTCRKVGVPLALVLLLLTACGRSEEGIEVSLWEQSDEKTTSAPDGDLRVGIGCMVSASATIELYGRLVEQLGATMNRRVRLVQRSSYRAMNDLVERQEVDCALVCTGAYLQGQRDFRMEALVVPLFDGEPLYRALILTREGSGLEQFSDLRGKRFAFVDPLSNTGRIYPHWRALDLGFAPDEFFDPLFTFSHDKSIRAVQSGVVDAASVDALVYESLRERDPRRVTGLRIVERSGTFGAPPVVVHPSSPASDRDRLRHAFLNLNHTDAGRRILEELSIDGFVIPAPDLYDEAGRQEEAVRRYDENAVGR